MNSSPAAENRPTLRPVQTQRASEAIYEQIKELIISGQFKPGDRLPSERALIDMLQRSRPTIREALRMLEREGFIRTVPGTNGAIVQELSTDGVTQSLEVMLQTSRVTLDELSEYRAHNDVAVARWAAQRADKSDIAALHETLDNCRLLMEVGDYPAFVAQDAVFHGQLALAGKNQVSYIISQVMSRLVEPMMLKALERQNVQGRGNMCQRIMSMHQTIFDAVCSGDPDKAAQAMVRHIETFGGDLKNFEAFMQN